jgi:hypothetical protein
MPAFAGMALLFLIKIPPKAVTPAKAGVPFVGKIIANDYNFAPMKIPDLLPRQLPPPAAFAWLVAAGFAYDLIRR